MRRVRRDLTIAAFVAALGVALASPAFYRWVDSWAPYSRAASREIGAAVVGGAIVGFAIVLLERRFESEQAQREADDRDRRERDQIRLTLALRRDLAGIDLAGRDLAGFRLMHKDLRNARLEGADLTNADLTNADLTGATLDDARLVDACLISAHFGGATLRRADLSGADLTGAAMWTADLTGATLDRAVVPSVNLSRVRLEGASLQGVIDDEQTSWPAGVRYGALMSETLQVRVSGDDQPGQVELTIEVDYPDSATWTATVENTGPFTTWQPGEVALRVVTGSRENEHADTTVSVGPDGLIAFTGSTPFQPPD